MAQKIAQNRNQFHDCQDSSAAFAMTVRDIRTGISLPEAQDAGTAGASKKKDQDHTQKICCSHTILITEKDKTP